MPEAVIRTENYLEGYRLTTTAGTGCQVGIQGRIATGAGGVFSARDASVDLI